MLFLKYRKGSYLSTDLKREATYQSGVATDEVVHSLSQAQLAHWWEDAKCVAS